MTWQIKHKTLDDYRGKYTKLTNGCWEWNGYKNEGGYGTTVTGSRIDGTRKQSLAHRVIYKLAYGDFDAKLCVCHTCDNPSCVNPSHLFLGTHAENHNDMVRKGRRVDLRGSKRPNAKLTEEQVGYIKFMLGKGIPQKVIARTFKVNQTLISAIKTGKIWSHV